MGLAPHLLLLCIVMTLQNLNLVTFNLASVFNSQVFDIFFVMLAVYNFFKFLSCHRNPCVNHLRKHVFNLLVPTTHQLIAYML